MPLNDIITSAGAAAYFNALYPIETFDTPARRMFPIQYKVGIDLKWIKGSKGSTVSLAPSAFDAKTTLRSRDGIVVTETQMPYFKEGYRLSETDRQFLQMIGDNGATALREQIIRRFYDDTAALVLSANLVPERMVYQLLFSTDGIPKIVFNENGANYAYNYGDTEWQAGHYVALTGADLWTAEATADPIGNITLMRDNLRKKYGTRIRYLIMNSNTFTLMGKTTALKNLFVLSNGNVANVALLGEQVRDVVRRATGCDIVIIDDVFTDEKGAIQTMVPDGYVAFVPDGPLGTMFRATTPAEADLIGKSDVDVSIVDSGIAITKYTKTDPVEVYTVASQIVLPTYERIDSVGLMKVIA